MELECPKCGYQQIVSNMCVKCGVIFAKVTHWQTKTKNRPSVLNRNLYFFKECAEKFKGGINYDIYDPETKELILECRDKGGFGAVVSSFVEGGKAVRYSDSHPRRTTHRPGNP